MDKNFLSKLTDEEIELIFQKSNLDDLLKPLQKDNKKYKKEIATFPGGRLDKKNHFVREKIPEIAFGLYQKQDLEYLKLVEAFVNSAYATEEDLTNFLGKTISLTVFLRLSTGEYVELLSDIVEKNEKFDINLFLLQLKILRFEFSNDEIIQIKNTWDKLILKIQIERECQKKYQSIVDNKIELVKKEYEEQFKNEKKEKEKVVKEFEQYKAENIIFIKNKQVQWENIEEKYKKILEESVKHHEELISNISEYDNKIKELERQLAKIEKEKITIEEELFSIKLEIEKKRDDIFDDIELEWLEKNENKQNIIKKLDENIIKLQNDKSNLEKEVTNLNERKERYDSVIDTYLDQIDVNMIQIKMQDTVGKWLNGTELKQNSLSTYPNPYVIMESLEDVEESSDYQEFYYCAQQNLKWAGLGRDWKLVLNQLVAAILSGLKPVIVGYHGMEVAQALAAAWFGEVPRIICLPAGYHDSVELKREILSSKSQFVIIDNAVGSMNETVFLPIMKDKSLEKNIIFICEDTCNLEYLTRFYLNYLYLIPIDLTEITNKEYNFKKSDLVIKSEYKSLYGAHEMGYSHVRKLFDNVALNKGYLLTRGNLFCILLKQNVKTNEIIELISKEIKYLISEEEWTQIEENIKLNAERFGYKVEE